MTAISCDIVLYFSYETSIAISKTKSEVNSDRQCRILYCTWSVFDHNTPCNNVCSADMHLIRYCIPFLSSNVTEKIVPLNWTDLTWQLASVHSFQTEIETNKAIKRSLCRPWTDTLGPRRPRFPEFLFSPHIKVTKLSALAPAAFNPRRYRWCSFQLENESTPGVYCGRKN